MEIKNQIEIDLKEALKSQNSDLLSVLRLLKSAIKNAEIAKGGELENNETLAVLEKQAKQRRDSIEQYKSGNREDLAENEQKELNIIQKYLPQKLSKEDTEKLVDEAIAETGANSLQQMGLVIKEVMAKANGAAEGSMVSQIVKEKLS